MTALLPHPDELSKGGAAPADRRHMALRQVTGLLLNGQLMMGPLI